MQLRYILILLVCVLLSCQKEQRLFIPNGDELLVDLLKSNFPPYSFKKTVYANSDEQVFESPKETLITLGPNLFNESQIANKSIDLSFIELASKKDLIIQNANITNDQLNVNHITSFYISANISNSTESILGVNNYINVRVPATKAETIKLGVGRYEKDLLVWDYFDTNRIKYTKWQTLEGDGVINEIEGYEISLDKNGWFALADVTQLNQPQEIKTICISHIDFNPVDKYYIIDKSNNFLSQITQKDMSDICIDRFNVTGLTPDRFQILCLRYLSDQEVAYALSDIFSFSQTIEMGPLQAVSVTELNRILDSL